MDLTGWVIRDGSVASASGRVLVVDGAVWFEGPHVRVMPSVFPRSAAGKGPYAVRAHGVAVDRLDRRAQYPDGTVDGWTTLTGTWQDRELHVHSQASPSDREVSAHRPTVPPCPAPSGGWPTSAIVRPMTAANLPARPPRPDEWAELTITQVTQFHPDPAQPVLVVAAGDPERVERALRRRFGASLCVVASRYRQEEIDAAVDRLREEMSSRRWPITMTGRGASSAGQATVTARFAWIEPEVAEWAATVPDGLLDVDVWLRPAA
jgi:hypothetical protein